MTFHLLILSNSEIGKPCLLVITLAYKELKIWLLHSILSIFSRRYVSILRNKLLSLTTAWLETVDFTTCGVKYQGSIKAAQTITLVLLGA